LCHEVLNLLTLVHYRQCVDDEEIEAPPSSDSDYTDLPGRHMTVNQIVALNMAYFRKADALTQEELGERLGWSKAIVSAAERSADGKRVRQFTVDDVVALAAALDVPVVAFFLPPEEDGVTARYLFRPHDTADVLDMGDLMAMAMPDSDSIGRAMDGYRRRVTAAVGRYLGPEWTDEPERWRRVMSASEIEAEQAEDARADYEALQRIAGKLRRVLKAYEKPEDEKAVQ
jgi:transcriptional regulator with XRE-family HTH domain